MKKHPILVILLGMVVLGLLISIGASIRSPAPTPPPTQTPLPTPTLPPAPPSFDYLTEMPEDAFLYVDFVDDDSTCLDNLCRCVQLEMSAPACVYKDGNLLINSGIAEDSDGDWLLYEGDWAAYRQAQQAVALDCYWRPSVSGFDFNSGFPFSTIEVIFTVLGVDAQGNILVQSPNGYTIVPVGGTAVFEQPELVDQSCKVLHIFTLENYGFIKDSDVVVKRF